VSRRAYGKQGPERKSPWRDIFSREAEARKVFMWEKRGEKRGSQKSPRNSQDAMGGLKGKPGR